MQEAVTLTLMARRMGYSKSHTSLLFRGLRGISWKGAKRLAPTIAMHVPGVTPETLMEASPDQLKALIEIGFGPNFHSTADN